MIKWPITYTDYNGEEHTEDFYFNLNKAEIMELNLKANDAYGEYLQRIVDQRDGEKIAEAFKNLILKAYGEKSPDGKRFMKKDENGRPLADKFAETEAYSVIFMELATDADAAAAFVNGIIPAKYSKEIEKQNHPALK